VVPHKLNCVRRGHAASVIHQSDQRDQAVGFLLVILPSKVFGCVWPQLVVFALIGYEPPHMVWEWLVLTSLMVHLLLAKFAVVYWWIDCQPRSSAVGGC
jgi:hypothetical protein